ncbi:MAG TPA: acyl carrier protein [Polyangiaceae bacterium]
MTNEDKKEQVRKVLTLLSVYSGSKLDDIAETRRLRLTDIGLSSLALASVVVELEDRLDRQFDFRAFAGVETVGGLLAAIGLQ